MARSCTKHRLAPLAALLLAVLVRQAAVAGDLFPPQEIVRQRLTAVAGTPQANSWKDRAAAALARIERAVAGDREAAQGAVAELASVASAGLALAERTNGHQTRRAIARAAYALARRAALYRAALSAQDPAPPAAEDYAAVARGVAAAASSLPAGSQGDAWRAFLLLPELRAAAASRSEAELRAHAEQVLSRFMSRGLSPSQRRFLGSPPLASLRLALRAWLDSEFHAAAILNLVEQVESTASPEAAAELARMARRLRDSTRGDLSEIGTVLDLHWRNANLRIAIHRDALTEMLPAQQAFSEPVCEQILDATVSGESQVSSRLSLSLTPDPRRWRIELKADGSIQSSTVARSGPASFYHAGQAEFSAVKPILFGPGGWRLQEAWATAESASQLQSMETNLDRVPLLGYGVRSIAMSQYRDRQPTAEAIMERRIAAKAAGRLDREAQERLARAQQQTRERVLSKLNDLGLDLAVLHTKTTASRLIARARLAGPADPGAYTPRPLALAGSDVSVQLHESALNNVIDSLELAGAEGRLEDILAEAMKKLGLPEPEMPDDMPEDVTVRFADKNPLSVRFTEGRISLVLRLARLTSPGRVSWRHFQVTANFRPTTDGGRGPAVVRDGIVLLEGRRLKFRDQIALRGVFSRIFERDRVFPLLPKRVAEHKLLVGRDNTQFEARAGWVGAAWARR